MDKRKNKKNIGLPPGSIIFTGDKRVEHSQIHYLEYNEQTFRAQSVGNQTINSFHEPTPEYVQWYDLRGIHDTHLIEEIGQVFNVHPLALEDIVDTYQRPKIDEYETGFLITLKAFSFDKKLQKTVFEQVTFYLGDGFLLSFQEKKEDLFENLRLRIQQGRGRVRKHGADYLLYVLMDTIVDSYYLGLEQIEEVIEEMEGNIIKADSGNYRNEIYDLKQEMLKIRKAIVPLRELLNSFKKIEGEIIQDATKIYLRDLIDHVIQMIELIESYRDNLNSLQDLYLSELSYRMNNVMQVLAVVSTIFIPLTFIVGVYGMNFDNMPELHWKYGYFFLLFIMLVIALLLYWIFRKRNWL